jgi:hypothetical protein
VVIRLLLLHSRASRTYTSIVYAYERSCSYAYNMPTNLAILQDEKVQ